jgi:tetratricopeptide (TPR) repeat protein
MDCRKSLVLALGLVGGAVGCVPQNSVPTVPTPPVIEKAKDLPVRPPKTAASCVAGGDFFASEAAGAPQGSTKQEDLYDRARKAYQQALDIEPNCLPAFRSLGKLYVTLGDRERALATYQKALQKHPKEATLWFDLGMCHARYKDWDRANEALRRAAEFDPENRQYHNVLGHCLARAGRYDEALAAYRKAAGEAHGEAQAHYNLARMLHHLNKNAEARQQLQLAVRAEPTFEAAQRLLAQLDGREPADPAVMPAGLEEPAGGGTKEH